ncbi:MAG: hypothetical protein WCE75_17390, partial [Terracidiphilus sp.]
MTSLPPIAPEIESELRAVHRLYRALAATGPNPEHDPECSPERGLGGKLLFAGSLDAAASRLVRAANIAGAA